MKSNLRKFNNPDILRELTYTNLITLLSQYKDYFKRASFDFENKSYDEFDFDELSAILMNKMFIGEYEELFNAFALIGGMSYGGMHENLIEFISAQPYKNELKDNMSTADLALIIYLHDPNALNDLDIQFNSIKQRTFYTYLSKNVLSNIKISSTQITDFENLLNNIFTAKNRGKTAKVYLPVESDNEVQIIVRCGETFKRQGAVKSEKVSKTVAFQPECHHVLFLNKVTGELRICVPTTPQWLCQGYYTSLGFALFKDYTAFEEKRINNLNKIKELGRNVLVSSSHTEIQSISLLSISGIDTDINNMKFSYKTMAGNLFDDFELKQKKLSSLGDIIEAKFLIKFNCEEKIITLKNDHRSGYEYDTYGSIIDSWLKHVGIIYNKQVEELSDVETYNQISEISVAI